MNSVVIGLIAWLAVQPVAVLAIFPLLRAASWQEPAVEPAESEASSPVVDLTAWTTTHQRQRA